MITYNLKGKDNSHDPSNCWVCYRLSLLGVGPGTACPWGQSGSMKCTPLFWALQHLCLLPPYFTGKTMKFNSKGCGFQSHTLYFILGFASFWYCCSELAHFVLPPFFSICEIDILNSISAEHLRWGSMHECTLNI